MEKLVLLLLVVAIVQAQNARRRECATFDGGINMCNYQNHEQMVQRLTRLAERFPNLAQMGSVGKSAQGRSLNYIKISNNVNRRSHLEPMFKFVGNMHGDETVGRQLILYMAHYLLQNYGRDARVTRLVDNTEIFLLPSMNPDGYNLSQEGCSAFSGLSLFGFGGRRPSGRNNANDIDLNRDFPKQFNERPDEDVERQPETAAMMRWIRSEPFVLSANMHAGAVVASYPYDDSPSHTRSGFYSAAPDDAFFKRIALIYADNHPVMKGGNACPSDNFPRGITNGAHWYDVPGGMQDFNYVHSNCFEITVELTCCKHPPAATLMNEWMLNKESMLSYMEAVHSGIKGDVIDADTRQPLQDAVIKIRGNGKHIRTTRDGEYWRLLVPGEHVISASANGYTDSEPIQINVSENQVVTHQIVLQRRN